MTVKVFRCEHLGAPSLSGTIGSLVALLDACLVNGYGGVGVVSIVRTGITATVTCANAHGYDTFDWVKIDGAAESSYVGEFRVIVTSATAFTFEVQGSPATPATGTITAIRAPAGFDKPFSATNLGVYRSKVGNRPFFQFDDTGGTAGGAREAKFRGFVSMSSATVGIEPFPTTAQVAATGLFCYKSNASSSTQRPWMVISDGKTVYIHTNDNSAPSPISLVNGGYTWLVGFGEIVPTAAIDNYTGFVAGMWASNQISSGSALSGIGYTLNRSYNPIANSMFMPRSYGGGEGAVTAGFTGHGWDQTCLGSLQPLPSPHPTDNGCYVIPMKVAQGWLLRGFGAGMYESLHGRSFMNGEIIENIAGLEGRRLMCVWCYSQGVGGCVLIDITGPWS